jgi:hypothetical protein
VAGLIVKTKGLLFRMTMSVIHAVPARPVFGSVHVSNAFAGHFDMLTSHSTNQCDWCTYRILGASTAKHTNTIKFDIWNVYNSFCVCSRSVMKTNSSGSAIAFANFPQNLNYVSQKTLPKRHAKQTDTERAIFIRTWSKNYLESNDELWCICQMSYDFVFVFISSFKLLK